MEFISSGYKLMIGAHFKGQPNSNPPVHLDHGPHLQRTDRPRVSVFISHSFDPPFESYKRLRIKKHDKRARDRPHLKVLLCCSHLFCFHGSHCPYSVWDHVNAHPVMIERSSRASCLLVCTSCSKVNKSNSLSAVNKAR